MSFFSALLTVLCALSVAAHISSTYTIHHRLYHPTLPHLPYTERGTVHISNDDSVSFHPSSSLLEDFISSTSQLDGSPDNLYYQLALQRGDEEQSLWDFTSVKACHLSQVTSQTIILHTKNATPFAVDYFVSPIPPDGSCPRPGSEPQSKATSQSPFAVFAENIRGLNSTVLLKSSHTPPLPELRKPQPLTPAGQPIQPVPEKSFIQKYWMYIAITFVVLVLAGGEEEGPRRQARA